MVRCGIAPEARDAFEAQLQRLVDEKKMSGIEMHNILILKSNERPVNHAKGDRLLFSQGLPSVGCLSLNADPGGTKESRSKRSSLQNTQKVRLSSRNVIDVQVISVPSRVQHTTPHLRGTALTFDATTLF